MTAARSRRSPRSLGRRRARSPLLTLALLAVAALATACAARPPATPPARPSPVPSAAATPTPEPTPTPVPPELACVADEGCAASPYPQPVRAVADCYCPTCPQPLGAGQAHANEVAWQRVCAGAWAQRARCLAPMCPRPAAPRCTGGACTVVTSGGSPQGF